MALECGSPFLTTLSCYNDTSNVMPAALGLSPALAKWVLVLVLVLVLHYKVLSFSWSWPCIINTMTVLVLNSKYWYRSWSCIVGLCFGLLQKPSNQMVFSHRLVIFTKRKQCCRLVASVSPVRSLVQAILIPCIIIKL